ncbi:MAG: cob(I)yrinic acid a,c-diamide adenosyltransferase [Patescibacteria group bacterium]
MKKLINISTKTGDTGQTDLLGGWRLSKDSLVIEAIGGVDELNSWLGLVIVVMKRKHRAQKNQLINIQRDLFDLGADLAESAKNRIQKTDLTQIKKTKFKQSALICLEETANKLQQSLAENWPAKFVLPGGTELGARLDVARTVCRRVERKVVGFQAKAKQSSTLRSLDPGWLKYLNRLSDYLFVLRCHVNHKMKYQEKRY